MLGFIRVYDTHRPHSSSFLGLPKKTLNMNPQKKKLLWGLWRGLRFGGLGSRAVFEASRLGSKVAPQ